MLLSHGAVGVDVEGYVRLSAADAQSATLEFPALHLEIACRARRLDAVARLSGRFGGSLTKRVASELLFAWTASPVTLLRWKGGERYEKSDATTKTGPNDHRRGCVRCDLPITCTSRITETE